MPVGHVDQGLMAVNLEAFERELWATLQADLLFVVATLLGNKAREKTQSTLIEHGFVECLAGMFRRLDWKFDLKAHREHTANNPNANGNGNGNGNGGANGGGEGAGAGAGAGAGGNGNAGGGGNGGVDMDEVDEFGDLPPLHEVPAGGGGANANGNANGNTGNANEGGDGLREGEHGPGCTCCPQACLQVSLLWTLAAYCEKSTPGSTQHHLLLDKEQNALVQVGS